MKIDILRQDKIKIKIGWQAFSKEINMLLGLECLPFGYNSEATDTGLSSYIPATLMGNPG